MTAESRVRTHTAAGHRLPISNGWAQHDGGPVRVYCGHCHDWFAADGDFASRYLVAQERDLTRATFDRPPYGLTQEEAADRLRYVTDAFRAAGLLQP